MQRTTKLPRLHKVTLNSFSLFRLQPTVAVDIDGDVFCLAGANGLGKSTFIAALNYGLTGGVAPPSIRVDQLPGYQRDAVAYGTRYFTGRIGELDRSGSSIELEFSVGEMHYRVRRRFFAPHELELFSVTTESGEVVVANEPSLDAEERHNRYTEQLLGDTGLQTFAQYVFLQHFVFTFDENRHLLFWDTRATELVLYLALGLDPSLAKRVDELRKAASASGSQARNSQYQATLARNELNSLTAQLKQKVPVDPDIVEQHRYLQAERERLTRERDSGRTDLRDAQLEFAEASAGLMRLRQQYDDAFARRIGISHSDPQLHPMLGQILADYLCRICGTQHDRAPEAIESAMHDRRCPLCQADLSAREVSEPNPDALVQIDRELAEAARRSGALTKTIERLDRELRRTQQELAAVIGRADALQERHNIPDRDAAEDATDDALLDRIHQLEGVIEVALGRKEEHLERRAEALHAYEPIQAALKAAWNEAELEFVPRFRRLAEQFIGLPLEVDLDAGTGISGLAHLVLSVNSSHRRRAEQLSESQRFFLDIALRMSIAQHMTGDSGPACLLIDTPEGALDIAYEARAGAMFSSFAAEGDQIVMTANVNTSQLLLRMAERCGRERMQFVRMTEWTTLTDVQVEEEGLFERAFAAIEDALDTGGNSEVTRA